MKREIALALAFVTALGCGGKAATPAPADGGVQAVAVPTLLPVPVAVPGAPLPAPGRPPLHLNLRSTPSGAAITVDGRVIGVAPAHFELADDARPHDFTFVLSGYAPWRLRFSPSRDGVVHATLQAVLGADAGID